MKERIRAMAVGYRLATIGSLLCQLQLCWACWAGEDSRAPTDGWARHTIDDSSRGADGVRLADMNGDGRPDIATGWEEGGITRVYQHPGIDRVRQPWPAVTVGKTPNVEDAVWVDLDHDGALDVVSSCEGNTRRLFVHWSPKDLSAWRNENAWRSEPIGFVVETAGTADGALRDPPSIPSQQWMFALPLDVDGKNGRDLVVGSKGSNAGVGWLESPKRPRDLASWRYHRWIDAGWIMSLRAIDMDGDADLDVLLSDRRGEHSGVRWLENPGLTRDRADDEAPSDWPIHDIGAHGREVLFLDVASPDDADAPASRSAIEIVAAVKVEGLLRFRRERNVLDRWSTEQIAWPQGCGRPKAVAIGDIDQDGKSDLVVSCEGAQDLSGVRWMSQRDGTWQDYEISGISGVKFDRIELVDLDEDGDLDVLTCEERDNLGVIWYENPIRSR